MPGNIESIGEISKILLQENCISEKQLGYAKRVQAKLGHHRLLVDVLKDLEFVTEDQITAAIRKNRLEMRLGGMLLELGIISQSDLDAALHIQNTEEQTRKIGDILVDQGFLDEKKLTEVLALHMGIPVVEARFKQIDPELMQMVPPALMDQASFLPLSQDEDHLVVAFTDPQDPVALDQVQQVFRQKIKPVIATKSDIQEAVIRYRKSSSRSTAIDEASVVSIVETIILKAIEDKASDIHIEPLPDRLRVRFRRDGVMEQYKEFPVEIAASLISRIKILCQADIAEKRRHQGGRILFEHPGGELDLRVSFYVTIHGETVVMRLLSRQGKMMDIRDIGMPKRMLKRFLQEVLHQPSGVFLVTGPTGSGKTSTVYSCLQYLNTPHVSIITAEDPVEFVIPGITQCSIDPKLQVTFEETLRHIVRQDPDIILIGEIRDAFSADIAVQAALTGHKVLTTFHTEDSVGGLIRLLNMDIESFLIASTVTGIVAQRLLRRVCPACAEPYKLKPAELQLLGYDFSETLGQSFRHGKGCGACRNTGYSGRVAVFESLIINEDIRHALLERRTSHDVRNISIKTSGLVTLLEEGLVKAARGITSIEEVFRCLPMVLKPRPLGMLQTILGD
ncbi:MAG: type II/IV secretion system protein [Desulfovibrionales bacterium]|nr:MAG: type II/IV secretion system protein [Desulfovibrionales bacterium]